MLSPQHGEELLERLVFGLDAVLDVGPVEARHKVAGGPEIETLGDLVVGDFGRGRGERDARNLGPPVVQHGELQVVGTEVVPPLRHTVGLVDREQCDGAAVEELGSRLDPQPLGGEVQQVEFTGDVGGFNTPAFGGVLGRVEEARTHTHCGERIHLVLHQRDKRRNHHTGALADERGDLVTQRFTAAGGHQNKGVAASDDLLDDLRLGSPKGVVAERFLEY